MQSFRLFMRLSRYIRMRWKLTAVAYLCTILNIAFNMAQPFLFSYLIDHVLIEKRMEWLVPILAVSLGLTLASVLLNISRAAIFRYLGIRHTLDLRDTVLAHIRKIPLTEIDKHGAGKYQALMGWDTATMGDFLNHIIVEMTSQAFTVLFAVSLIFYMDWKLGVMTLVCIPLVMIAPRLFKGPITRNVAYVRSHNEEIGTHLLESIEASREIRSFGLEDWERKRNEKLYSNLVKASTKESLYRLMSGQSGFLVIGLIVIMVYGFGSGQVLEGTLSIGMMVAAVQYFNNALNPVQVLNDLFGEMQRGEIAMARIEEFLHSPVEKAGMAAANRNDKSLSPGIDTDIRGSNLSVTYEDAAILNNVNFEIKRGQFTAIVGRSGSGKTSLFKTLLGFMPISGGELDCGGIPLEQWTRNEIASRFGAVFQENYIFSGTIYENIAIGKLGVSEEEVYEAAREANLLPLIDRLPEGLHTRIGHQGIQLSGGERQRVAIARIMLKKPDILILDEPTSALDRATEQKVMEALFRLMKGRTMIISTHRLYTVEASDIIYVLDNGAVLDCGTHRELLERCDVYAALAAGQSSEGKVEIAV